MKPKILIIDDEECIVESLMIQLEQNFDVTGVTSIAAARSAILKQLPDIIILDRILPEESGDSFCEELKNDRRTRDIYIVLLSCLVREDKIIEGFETLCADDYLKKPFSPREIESRIRAVARRLLPERIVLADIVIDRCTMKCCINGTDIDLSAHEFCLLYKLAGRPEQIFTFAILQETVWNEFVSKQALQKCVSRVNQKAGKNLIESVRNTGYRMCVEH